VVRAHAPLPKPFSFMWQLEPPSRVGHPQDLLLLEGGIRSLIDCRLVIIDPISSYLGAVDSHKNSDVRGVLAALTDLATRHRLAVVAVTHLNKAGFGRPVTPTSIGRPAAPAPRAPRLEAAQKVAQNAAQHPTAPDCTDSPESPKEPEFAGVLRADANEHETAAEGESGRYWTRTSDLFLVMEAR
jgi:hypothetical protein